MLFKNIIEQINYYSQNAIDFDNSLKLCNENLTSINMMLGHYKIFSDYEAFNSMIKSIDNEQDIIATFEYFLYDTNNIILYQIFNRLVDIVHINSAKDAEKFIQNISLNANFILNSKLSNIKKAILLYFLKENYNELKNEIIKNDINDMHLFIDETLFFQSILPIEPSFYINIESNITNKELKDSYLFLINKNTNDMTRYESLRLLSNNNSIDGVFKVIDKKFEFIFNDSLQFKYFYDFNLNYMINDDDHSIKLELELMNESSDTSEIDASLVFINGNIFAVLGKKEESFLMNAKDSLIYNLSEIMTRTIKVINHPYTKLAIATVVIAGGLLHSTDSFASDTVSNGIHDGHSHLSESQISQIMSHTKYLSLMKHKAFGMANASDADLTALHHKEMWKSVDHQLEQLGIDINSLNAKHFNRMSITNKIDWIKTNDGYEFHGGGLRARFVDAGDHFNLITTDRGQSEIVPQDLFLEWSNKILKQLNEVKAELHSK